MHSSVENSWPFYYLPESVATQIQKIGLHQKYSRGQSILTQEQPREFAYILLDGLVDRFSIVEGVDHFEERLFPFAFFGFAVL